MSDAHLRRVRAAAAKELGNAAFKARDYAEAVAQYTAAIDADNTDAAFYSNRCACPGLQRRAHVVLCVCVEGSKLIRKLRAQVGGARSAQRLGGGSARRCAGGGAEAGLAQGVVAPRRGAHGLARVEQGERGVRARHGAGAGRSDDPDGLGQGTMQHDARETRFWCTDTHTGTKRPCLMRCLSGRGTAAGSKAERAFTKLRGVAGRLRGAAGVTG